MITSDIAGVAGVPETRLSEALLATLPVDAAPAPWEVTCDGVVWWSRGGAAATAALPPALRATSTALGVVGGFVRYSDTPVGQYDEVFGQVASRTGRTPWGSVTFMSVDSAASLVGGRGNWAMPKTLGTFDGEIQSGRTMTGQGADTSRWRVSAAPRAHGPTFPVRSRAEVRQEFGDGRVGRSRLTARGRARLAVVTVEVESDGPLASWLRPGRHLGAVVTDVVFSLAVPTFDVD